MAEECWLQAATMAAHILFPSEALYFLQPLPFSSPPQYRETNHHLTHHNVPSIEIKDSPSRRPRSPPSSSVSKPTKKRTHTILCRLSAVDLHHTSSASDSGVYLPSIQRAPFVTSCAVCLATCQRHQFARRTGPTIYESFSAITTRRRNFRVDELRPAWIQGMGEERIVQWIKRGRVIRNPVNF